MSRIGKQPIELPASVKVSITGNVVSAEGPKGKLSLDVHPLMQLELNDNVLTVKRPNDGRQARSLHGLTRTLVSNMVVGVSKGFERNLEIKGVGYRAEMKGNALHLALGFSHPVIFDLPEGVKATVDGKKTGLKLESIDKQLLGATAAKIRSFRPPEPYGGKGIKYAEEVIIRKEGKSAGK